ncbi:MAG TPA: phosphotransferase [Patescibacteria group bacterium]|nr:phosphotransferase [Patescibacteria group bacterium]
MPALLKEPAAREKKPELSDLPPGILRQIEVLCGAKIASSDIAYGGLSSSAGFIMTLQSGRRIFAKGTHPAETAHGAANLAQEITAYQTVEALREVSPPYIGVVSDGQEDGWMLGLWEYVDHEPKLLSLPRLMEAVRRWQAFDGAAHVLPAVRDQVYLSQFFAVEKKWQRLKNDVIIRKKFCGIFSEPWQAESWLGRNIDALVEWQIRASRLNEPAGLIHGDLRSDNFLFTADRAYAVDWPNACYGPLVFDQMFLFSNLEGEGHGLIEDLMSLFGGYITDDAVAMLAALSGYFGDQAYRDVPERMPRLRWMQKSMLLAQLKCLSRLGIIESIPRMTDENQQI